MLNNNIILSKIKKYNYYAIVCGLDLINDYFNILDKAFTLYTNASREILEEIFKQSDCYLMAYENSLAILHKDYDTGVTYNFRIKIREEKNEEECIEHLMQQMTFNIEKVFFSAHNGLIDLGGQWNKMISNEDYYLDIDKGHPTNESILSIFNALLINNSVKIPTNLIKYFKSISTFAVNPLSIGYELKNILESSCPEKIIAWEHVGIMQYVFPEFHYLFETEADTLYSKYDNLGLETINIIKGCSNYTVCLAAIFYQIGKIYSTISAAMNIKIYLDFEEKSLNVANRRLKYYMFDDDEIEMVTKMIKLCKEKIPPQYYQLKEFIIDNFNNKNEITEFFTFRNIIAKLINPNKAPDGIMAVEIILNQLVDDWSDIGITESDINRIYTVTNSQALTIIRDIKLILLDNPEFIQSGNDQLKEQLIKYFLISEEYMPGDIDQINTYIDINPMIENESNNMELNISDTNSEDLTIEILLAERDLVVEFLSSIDFDKIKRIKKSRAELADDDFEYLAEYNKSVDRLDEINNELILLNVFSKEDADAIIANQEVRKKLVEEEHLMNKLNNIYVESDTSFFEEIFNFSKNEQDED